MITGERQEFRLGVPSDYRVLFQGVLHLGVEGCELIRCAVLDIRVEVEQDLANGSAASRI